MGYIITFPSDNSIIQTEDYLEKLYLKMKTNSLLSSLVISIFLYDGEAWAFNKDLEQCFLELANEDVTGALHHAYHDQREDTQESYRAHWEVWQCSADALDMWLARK